MLVNNTVVARLCVLFQAEDGIRDLVRSRGLGDVYKRQGFVLSDYTDAEVLRVQEMVSRAADAVAVLVEHGLSLIHI